MPLALMLELEWTLKWPTHSLALLPESHLVPRRPPSVLPRILEKARQHRHRGLLLARPLVQHRRHLPWKTAEPLLVVAMTMVSMVLLLVCLLSAAQEQPLVSPVVLLLKVVVRVLAAAQASTRLLVRVPGEPLELGQLVRETSMVLHASKVPLLPVAPLGLAAVLPGTEGEEQRALAIWSHQAFRCDFR